MRFYWSGLYCFNILHTELVYLLFQFLGFQVHLVQSSGPLFTILLNCLRIIMYFSRFLPKYSCHCLWVVIK